MVEDTKIEWAHNTHNHWLLLTKRPENAMEMLPQRWLLYGIPSNVWIGTSVENQEQADKRIPHLLKVPAAVRFLSCEPLLGPVDLQLREHPGMGTLAEIEDWERSRIHWVIVGGESGPNARPMHPDWARSLRDQCQAAGVPFFFKQWGEWCYYDNRIHGLGDPRTPDKIGGHPVIQVPAGPPRLERRVENCGPYDYRPVGEPVEKRWYEVMIRVGKKSAGRLLDGRTWDEFPSIG